MDVELVTSWSGGSPAFERYVQRRARFMTGKDVRGLILKISEYEDGCWLRVRLRTDSFSGIGEAWLEKSRLERFARALLTYPLKGNPELTGGYGGSLDGNVPPQTTVSLRMYMLGQKGQLGARVELETTAGQQEVGRVEAELLTSHQRLQQFATDLLRVLESGEGTAVLGEDRLI